jgi:PKD repeat protein
MNKRIIGILVIILFVFSSLGNISITTNVTKSHKDGFDLIGVNKESIKFDFTCNAGGPYYGIVGEPVQFYGSASGGYEPYSWSWDFGDDTTSDEQNPTHTYMEAGDYSVIFTVTDYQFQTCYDSTTATITDDGGDFTCDADGPYYGMIGESIQFYGSASGGNKPYSWDWTFGDGDTSELQNSTHTYTEVGEYSVTLTVTDYQFETCSDSTTATIFEDGEDTEPPVIVITSPENGTTFYEANITMIGYISDNVGISWWGYLHEWQEGESSDTIIIEDYPGVIEWEHDFKLQEGTNKITISAGDKANNIGKKTVVYVHSPGEGLKIESVFQPVQVVYPDDMYGDDISKISDCQYVCKLGMVVDKNTFLFGYPTKSEKDYIKIKVHNNYSTEKTFRFVFSIEPPHKVIWRSDPVTMPPKSKKTFPYKAPIPPEPFKWRYWGDKPKTKLGSIKLYLEPDVTGGKADYKCKSIELFLSVQLTHELNVLVIPFTFRNGPPIPSVMTKAGSEYFKWLDKELTDWWLAIYPVRESVGVFIVDAKPIYYSKEIGGEIIDSLEDYQKDLSESDREDFRNKMYSLGLAYSYAKNYHRTIYMVPRGFLDNAGKVAGRAKEIGIPPKSDYKYGAMVIWDCRSGVPAHEVGHTYGLSDNYKLDKNKKLIYRGDKTEGYWVNKKIPIDNKTYDLMGAIYPLWGSTNYPWIKKDNFKKLLHRFTYYKDPVVLGISGFIDKNDNVELNPWYKIDQGNIDLEWGTTGDYLIRIYDKNGFLLNEAGFNLSFQVSIDPLGNKTVNKTLFAFRVEWINDTYKIDIVNSTTGEILAFRTISDNSPEITILSPQLNENINQGTYNITWDAYDKDRDNMVYHVSICRENEENWYPFGLEINESYFIADFRGLQGNYKIEILATDGINVGTAVSDIFTILPDETPPNIELQNPRNGLYISDRKIIPLPFTIIIGDSTIEVNSTDDISVLDVCFYIDNDLKYVDYNNSNKWYFNESFFGIHTLKVEVNDYSMNTAFYEQKLFIINLKK